MKTSLIVTGNNLFTIIPYKDELLKFTAAKLARVYYKNHYIDLLTGKTHVFNIEEWVSSLDFPVYDHALSKRVIHLFYELGFLFEKNLEALPATEILAMDIEYKKIEKIALKKNPEKIILKQQVAPEYASYKKQFDQGYNELFLGNCYQFNLTGQYVYEIGKKIKAEDFIARLWREPSRRGAYASATYSEILGQLYLSNSPECLFQYDKGLLTARPVKGTLKKLSDKKEHIKKLWHELTHDKKSQAELFMITDLLRNDLCRIDEPAARVTKKKALLTVPGLIHQYSEIEINLRRHITLKNILEKVFPGGSITGAPKKRVMDILKNLETRPRGFYCGSTLLFNRGQVMASINIRSSVIDFKKSSLIYQSGGGITLLSEPQSEFLEMTYKKDSFIDTLTL